MSDITLPHTTSDERQRMLDALNAQKLAGEAGGTIIDGAPTISDPSQQTIAGYAVRVLDPATNRREVTDKLGRKLVVQDLSSVERLDLYEACGANSTNPMYLSLAMTAATLRSVSEKGQTKGRVFPKRPDHIRGALQLLGTEGLEALQSVSISEMQASAKAAEAAAEDGDPQEDTFRDQAKN